MKLKLTSLILICAFSIQAQTYTSKVVLQKGQKITAQTTMNSNTSMEMQGNKMENNTNVISFSTLEIIDIANDNYKYNTVLNQIKIDFEGFGQKMKYDSDDKTTHDNMIGKNVQDKIGKADTFQIKMDGNIIKEEKKEENEKADKKKGGRMQKMMMGNSNTDGSDAFFIIPAEVKVGDSWKKDINENDLHTQTIYTLDVVDGDMATISTKERSKGTVKGENQGMEMATDIDNFSSGSILVNIKNGLVKKIINKTEVKSKTSMMGQEMPSTGSTTVTTEFN